MSPKARLATALIVLAAMTCGSLGALPLGPGSVPTWHGRGHFLTTVMEWINAFFGGDDASRGAQTKAGTTMDPNGGGE